MSASLPEPGVVAARSRRLHRAQRRHRHGHLRHAARAQVRGAHAVAHRAVSRRAARPAAADRRRAEADDEGRHRADARPTGAIFNLAPIVFLVPCMLIFATIPFAPGLGVADLNIGILFFLAVSSMEIVGLFMAGWGSNNKYALLSAMRAVNQIISYDLPFIFAALVPVLLAGSLQLSDIAAAQDGPLVRLLSGDRPAGLPRLHRRRASPPRTACRSTSSRPNRSSSPASASSTRG